ncbi:MAG: hypothetical protein ACPLRY_01470 [Candidatus Bathyarchaeales archaeon]
MLETIIKRLKTLESGKKGVSNVIVVMLSLVLIVIIVANVVLWNYQMNQLDLERMQETLSVANVMRLTRSQWFAVQKEFSISVGNKISGSYIDTKLIDGLHEKFVEEIATLSYNPSTYNLIGYTSLISGTVNDLQGDNGVYLQLRSYPYYFSENMETFGNTVAGTLNNRRNTENTIVGSLFVPAKDGEAQSIAVYIRMTSNSKRMRCAIYLHDNLTLIAQTEEILVPVGTAWVTFNFQAPKPVLRANTEYLLVAWSESGNGYAYLHFTSGTTNKGHYISLNYGAAFPNQMPAPTHDNRAYSIYCNFKPATEERIEVEFTGTSDTNSWASITWTIDVCSATESVNATFQLFNYQSGHYPTSGNGYMTAIIGTPDTTVTQSITVNSTHFRDDFGGWRLKVIGLKAAETPFDLNVDWIEFKVTSPSVYRLDISNQFVIDLSTYPLSFIDGVEVLIRYNVSEASERWFIKAYNWSGASFSDLHFNATGGNQPIINEWNNYSIKITEDLTNYVNSNGTFLIKFYDEGLSGNQSTVSIDFFGVRVILDGALFGIKNGGPLTVHIVSIWVVTIDYHKRYDAEFFINSGESTAYIRADISLPDGNFTVKVVTERGNIVVFTGS